MSHKAFAVIVTVFSISLIAAVADATAADRDTCYVSITSPAPGASTGREVVVTGKAAVCQENRCGPSPGKGVFRSSGRSLGGSVVPDAKNDFTVLVTPESGR
jgi:hypothetical protein